MNPSKLSERQAGDVERQKRLRLFITGKGPLAQRLLEAEVLNEQQRPTSNYTQEVA